MIRKAERKDLPVLGQLGAELWPHHAAGELAEEFEEIMEEGGAFFLAFSGEEAFGFAQCQLRHDYVEGTSTSPVGYLEGIYVKESSRRRGLARRLLAACENWAREQGCREFASDCQLENRESLILHKNLGFRETGRIICFAKKL